jgi:hypothetical protein
VRVQHERIVFAIYCSQYALYAFTCVDHTHTITVTYLYGSQHVCVAHNSHEIRNVVDGTNAQSMKALQPYCAHRGRVDDMLIVPAHGLLVTCGTDCAAKMWNLKNTGLLRRLTSYFVSDYTLY